MSDRFFFTSPAEVDDSKTRLKLPPDESHHAISVLRLQKGDFLTVSDGVYVYEGKVSDLNKRAVEVEIASKRPVILPEVKIYLHQAIPKANKAEFIVEKCTEIGVFGFVFFYSQNSIGSIKEKKLERLKKIAISASKQSKRDVPPEVVIDEEGFGVKGPSMLPEEIFVAFDEKAKKGIKETFKELHLLKPRVVRLFVGPEGGFSEKDREVLQNIEAYFVKIGSTILKVETASIVAVALVNNELECW